MTQEQQLKAIRLSNLKESNRLDTCGDCGLTGVFTYTLHGYGLCPECDADKIETYKQRG